MNFVTVPRNVEDYWQKHIGHNLRMVEVQTRIREARPTDDDEKVMVDMEAPLAVRTDMWLECVTCHRMLSFLDDDLIEWEG